MSDLLRSLEGELEVFRRRVLPRFDRLRRRHPIERVIDLDAVELGRVIREKLLLGEVRRVEHRPPFFVTEARGAEPNPRHWRIMAQLAEETPVNVGLKHYRVVNT